MSRIPSLALALGLLALTGCVVDPNPSEQPVVAESPEIVLPPPPQRPLTAGVYSCIDTTGQRRPSLQPQELSTAVPMDCTPYLIEGIRALSPGYLSLVERQHVDELLRERQIATLALNANMAPGQPGAPPPRHLASLKVAEVLMIGQVVAYDRQTRQAAAGFSLAGVGIVTAYVQDVMTFSLRAVAVTTGEVLGEATVTKSVVSIKAGGHDTQVWPTTVMEAELGGAGNEPVGLALRLAVRTALATLVQKGIHDGWWQS